jgi:hypothetical protein
MKRTSTSYAKVVEAGRQLNFSRYIFSKLYNAQKRVPAIGKKTGGGCVVKVLVC